MDATPTETLTETAIHTDIAGPIREWLRDNVAGQMALPDDLPLMEQGILTSLQTVNLVLFLEERFGITIEEDEFVEENFASIAAISALVATKLPAGAGA